jgi:drug/metabolite transporter (DMT)-like permease
MLKLILGIAAAVSASTLYSLGVALQAMDAKRTPQHEHLHPALALNLLRRARWLAGTGLSMLGWPLQVAALLLVSLVIVQPTMAVGLLVLLFFGQRMLDERAGRREHLAVCAIVLGVVGTALTGPGRSTTHTNNLTVTLVLAGLGLLTLLPYLVNRVRRPAASLTMVAAGLGFAWSGVATKLFSDDLSHGRLWVAAAWGISTAGASAVAALSEMSALQMRPAIQVAPVVFVTQTVVPVVLAPLLLGESFSGTPLGGVPLSISLAVLVVGAAALARSPLLTNLFEVTGAGEALIEGEAVSEPSGSSESPSERSQETIRLSPATDGAESSIDTTSTSPARVRR